jgi:hypothetical protein
MPVGNKLVNMTSTPDAKMARRRGEPGLSRRPP